MNLDDRTEVLVAIGSAAAVNCQDCLDRLRHRAAAEAIDPAEVAAATQVGLRVGRRAAAKSARLAATSRYACCGAPTEEGW